MIKLGPWKWMFIICLTIVVNGIVLALIPILSGDTGNNASDKFSDPVLLTLYKAPAPLPREKEKKIVPRSEEIAKKIPVIMLQTPNMPRKKPKVNLNIRAFDFQVNPKLEIGTIDVGPLPENTGIETSLFSKEFGMGEVDQLPRLIRRVEPMYPYSARMRGIAGKVIVKFLVDSKGQVRKPVILKAFPKGVFEETVLQAVQKWKFKPGYWQGHPVATWVVLPIQFKLSG